MKPLSISNAMKYTLIVSLGGFIFGFDASVISGAIGFITEEFNLSAWQQGLVVSAPTLGGLIATMLAGPVADAIGRKQTLLITASLYFISALLSAFANTFETLVLARFIGGMAFCALMVAPMYIAEISLPEQRGRLVSVNQLNIVIGLFISYFSNYFLLQLSQLQLPWVNWLQLGSNTWRWMLGIEAIPALLWMLMLLALPKSPRWLLMKKQDSAAQQTLQQLYSPAQALSQQQNIHNDLNSDYNRSGSVLAKLKLLFSKKLRLALGIGLLLGIAQQVSGINVVFFYAPTIFEQSGVGTNAAFVQAIWIGLINVIFTVVAMLSIDKLGRRPLLIIGLIGISFSMALCSWGFKQATYQLTPQAIEQIKQAHPDLATSKLMPLTAQRFDSDVSFNGALKSQLTTQEYRKYKAQIIANSITMPATLVLAGISIFVAAFAMSLGPVMWVMFSEIFPNSIRAVAISVVGVVNNAASFTVQLIFPWELETFGASTTFLLYSACSMLALLLVFLFVKETKGQSLEQLSAKLTANS
ncbi:sugar porter family MFS transporter [Pseudoalteromonas 'SMAR']|uniref:sugar porter family MFS transporter n=1 Tax=Pseudoalteromonas 'SMAR' TaxID=3416908 RepID=UPI003AF30283